MVTNVETMSQESVTMYCT